jgi:hypothetical protein
MNIGKFNLEKFNLVLFHIQTIPNVDIHKSIGLLGLIRGGISFAYQDGYEDEKQYWEDETQQYIKELNQLCRTDYSISDFIDEPKENPA